MNKEGINYILLNSTLFVFIIYIIYKLNILEIIFNLFITLFLSTILSYIIYPIYKRLNIKLNKYISLLLIYTIIILFIILLLYSIIPNIHFFNKIIDLITNIIKFLSIITNKLNITLDLNSYLEKIINYILNNGVDIIKNIFNYLTKFIFIIILSICILLNIDYIKNIIINLKYKDLIYRINNKLKEYLIANIKIVLIQFFEYTIVFLIIGHPNYLLLGILNSINSFIPFVGSLLTNIIAITTSSVISRKLLILTTIVSIIMPNIDAYVINPKIYKDTNKIPETLSIASIIIGGSIFGFYGIIFSLPILIVIFEILKYKNIVKEN